jgi:DNA-binding response OmpR family regulator
VAKVLIVDDEPACRESLRLLLLSLDEFQVSAVADGQEALSLAKQCAPDVLIADWKLPGEYNGLQVAAALRADNAGMRVIMITGYPSDELESQVKALPGYQYFSKPFVPGELLAAVRKAARGTS